MSSKHNSPFFTELGKILNLIRNISTELNAEMRIEDNKSGKLFDVMHTRNDAIEKLKDQLQQTETEIEYFFTENGIRKIIENSLNTSELKRKFTHNFKILSKQYFKLMPKANHDVNEHFSGNEEPIF